MLSPKDSMFCHSKIVADKFKIRNKLCKDVVLNVSIPKKSERITKSEKYFVFDQSKKNKKTKILKIYRHYCH